LEHQLTIKKTVRYFTYGNPKAKTIWIVLHGYSQLPEFFIKKFETLDPNKNYVVAPEGMHRFYRRGTSGRVGASWMTKEARLDDIADNIHYLDTLYNELSAKNSYKNRILLGFSQGGATAARWHYSGNFKAQHFILWASVFPPDLPIEKEPFSIFQSNNYFVVGKEDQYFKDNLQAVEDFFKKQQFDIEIIYFEEDHDIYPKTLKEVSQLIKMKVLR